MTPIILIGRAIIPPVEVVQTPIPVLIFRKTLLLGLLTSIAVETIGAFPLPRIVTRSTPTIAFRQAPLFKATLIDRFLPIAPQLHPERAILISVPLAPLTANSLTFRAIVVFRPTLVPDTTLPNLVATFPPFLPISLLVDPVLSLERPLAIPSPLPLLPARSAELVLVIVPLEVRLDRSLVSLLSVALSVSLRVEALVAIALLLSLSPLHLEQEELLLLSLLVLELLETFYEQLVSSLAKLESIGTPGARRPRLPQARRVRRTVSRVRASVVLVPLRVRAPLLEGLVRYAVNVTRHAALVRPQLSRVRPHRVPRLESRRRHRGRALAPHAQSVVRHPSRTLLRPPVLVRVPVRVLRRRVRVRVVVRVDVRVVVLCRVVVVVVETRDPRDEIQVPPLPTPPLSLRIPPPVLPRPPLVPLDPPSALPALHPADPRPSLVP